MENIAINYGLLLLNHNRKTVSGITAYAAALSFRTCKLTWCKPCAIV